MIKHDVVKFIGSYNQIKGMNKSCTKEANVIRSKKYLYCTKSAKNTKFLFEHCWELVKEFSRWVDGVNTSWQSTLSRRVPGSSYHNSQAGSQLGTPQSMSVVETTGEGSTSMAFTLRSGGTKAKIKVQRVDKVQDKATLTQTKAAKVMAEATLRKAASLKYHNMLFLFTTPMD